MNVVLKIDDLEFAPALLTGADVLEMTKAGVLPEGRGYELIEGALVKMAAQYGPHVATMMALTKFLVPSLPDELGLAPGPSIFLSDHVMLEPDLCVLPVGMVSTDVRGPDIALAIEVSDSSRIYDLGKKARLYARHGVAHYWVVDLIESRLHRHTGPGEDGYAGIEVTAFDVPAPLPFAPDTPLVLSELL